MRLEVGLLAALLLATTTATAAPPVSPPPRRGAKPAAAPPAEVKPADADRERVAPAGASAVLPFDVSLDGGVAVMMQSFHSNGESRPGRLADYDFAAQGASARLALRHAWSLGTVVRLGVGGFYRYAGLTGVNAPADSADGTRTNVRLGIQSHQAAATLTAGVRSTLFRGLALDAQVGPALLANYIEIDARAPLPSDRTIGVLSGLRLAAPALVQAGGHAVGVVLEGSWVGFAVAHDQTPNLEDGPKGSSKSLLLGAELAFGLLRSGAPTQVALTAGYQASLQSTTYDGASARNGPANGNVSAAERVGTMHVAALGVRLSH